MATTMSKSQQARKVVSKDVKQMVEPTAEVPEEIMDPLAELMNQAQTAYTSYLQAQRKVAEAYQERQRQGETSYKEIEEKGYFLPLSEVTCKYVSSARYDDELIIEATLDSSVKGGVKFDYIIYRQGGNEIAARGSTLHAFVNLNGQVVRPPAFFKKLIEAD